MATDKPEEEGARYVTVASYNWLRDRVTAVVADLHDLRTGLMGSAMFPDGKIADIEKELLDIRALIANLPATIDQQRAARSWRGWREWALGALGTIVVSLVLTALTLWIFSTTSQLGVHVTK